jgi:hypothetical protein
VLSLQSNPVNDHVAPRSLIDIANFQLSTEHTRGGIPRLYRGS